MHLRPPGSSDDMPGVLTVHPNDSTGHGPKPVLARKSFLLCVWGGGGFRGGLLPAGLGVAQNQDGDLGLMLEGVLQ
jgi:hypothetical protein